MIALNFYELIEFAIRSNNDCFHAEEKGLWGVEFMVLHRSRTLHHHKFTINHAALNQELDITKEDFQELIDVVGIPEALEFITTMDNSLWNVMIKIMSQECCCSYGNP